MDTVRVNIVYRPLRICWAIKQGDFAAFREAVQTNHALWGGRFNPIVIVDRPSEARALVEAFRADIVQPVGASEEVEAFAATFKHLISPFVTGYEGTGVESLYPSNTDILRFAKQQGGPTGSRASMSHCRSAR